MNLNYSILWFDDDKDYLDSLDKEPIETEIKSWGFIPKLYPVHNQEELHKHEPFDNYDLIVVDFDLGGYHGDAFIEQVRQQNVYSEIIFYSFKDEDALWESIRLKKLEGVFVTNKKQIIPKLLRVAQQSVRKVLDLDNMRGIVMSEVGELDGMLENIFNSAIYGVDQEHMNLVFDKFHQDLDASTTSLKESLEAFRSNPSIEGLLGLTDSSEKKWQTFNRIRRHHKVLKGSRLSTQYSEEILFPRNCLAHGTPTRQADGTFIFMHRGKEFIFNDEVSKSLRHKIMEYKEAFAEITNLLKADTN